MRFVLDLFAQPADPFEGFGLVALPYQTILGVGAFHPGLAAFVAESGGSTYGDLVRHLALFQLKECL